MKKKKIIFIITKSNFGGAQRYVYDIATSLSINEFDIVVALGGNGLLKEKLNNANIRTISIKGLGRDVKIFNEIRVFYELFKLYRKEKPDIIHLNSSKIGGIGALVGRITRIPNIIFTAHGWAFNEERSLMERKIIALLHWFTLILVHTTIAVSEQIKDQMSHFPFIKHKITVIYNGAAEMNILTKQNAQKFFLEQNKKMASIVQSNTLWVGTISELHTTKGLEYSIEAVEKLVQKKKDVIFIIIGEGENRDELHTLIKEKGLAGKIFLLGFIDNAAKYLRAFDIFTLTSISEALSYTILEAGLSESAIVASDVGGIPEIITSKESGLLVPPRDSNAIASALYYLIENKEKREQFGICLKQKVEHDFSLQKMLIKTIEVYQS